MSTPKEPRQFTVREFHWRDGDITFDIVPDDYEGGEPHKKFIVREVLDQPPVQREEWIKQNAKEYRAKVFNEIRNEDYGEYSSDTVASYSYDDFFEGARQAFAVADAEKAFQDATIEMVEDAEKHRRELCEQLASRDKTISELVEALEKIKDIGIEDRKYNPWQDMCNAHDIASQALQKAKVRE